MKYWDQPWNPVVGCWGPFSQIQLLEDRLEIPLKRKKPTVFFCCNMSDLFHPEVPFRFIEKVMAIIESCPQHTFLMAEYFNGLGKRFELSCCPNLWLGTTVCNQAEADKNIPLLLQTPAAHRWISIEPMLSEINLDFGDNMDKDEDSGVGCCPCDNGGIRHQHYINELCLCRRNINQVILGGETASKDKEARPMHPDWARKVRDDCKAAGVPFMFKQWGEYMPTHPNQKEGDILFRSDGTITGKWETDNLVIRSIQRDERIGNDYSMRCIGKKKAGRLLDGELHNELAWRYDK